MTKLQALRKAKNTAKRTGVSHTVWRSTINERDFAVTPHGAGAPQVWNGAGKPIVTFDPKGNEFG